MPLSEDNKGVSEEPPQAGKPESETPPISRDKFRHGKIVKFSPQSRYGFIRDEGGKEVYFHLDEVRLLGEKKDRSFVLEGTAVGFDVGLTSRGLRVTYLKIY